MKSYIACSIWEPKKGTCFSGIRMEFNKKGELGFTTIRSSSEILHVDKIRENVFAVQTRGSMYILIVVNVDTHNNIPKFGYTEKIIPKSSNSLQLVDIDYYDYTMTDTGETINTETIKKIKKIGDNAYILISASEVYYAMLK